MKILLKYKKINQKLLTNKQLIIKKNKKLYYLIDEVY